MVLKPVPLFNKQAGWLCLLAFMLNLVFLYMHNPHVYFAITQAHGQIGYNLYKHNALGMNPELSAYMQNAMQQEGQLIAYDNIKYADFGPPTEPFPINDTIGYGVLLGLLWKLTDSLQFYDVQLLQIIIFCLLMLFYYQLAYLLFGSMQLAFLCGLAQLLFFPLISFNVMPVRDIWAYYGLLILCYGMLAYIYEHISWLALIGCFLFFAVCLWMRPTVCLAAIILSLFVIVFAVKQPCIRQKAALCVCLLWLTTGLFFWLPFIRFNVKHYGHYLVSPAGQSMLEGLGELSNKWGHQLSDSYVNQFIGQKYGLQYGTPAFDEAALYEFKQCVKEDPWHYIKTLLYRLPDILLPGLQWRFYTESPYQGCSSFWHKLQKMVHSWPLLLDVMLRHLFIRVYIVIGYVGLWLMIRQKRFMQAAWIICMLLSGLSTYPSHIESRYIVPFYWAFSILVGYAWFILQPLCFVYKAKGYMLSGNIKNEM